MEGNGKESAKGNLLVKKILDENVLEEAASNKSTEDSSVDLIEYGKVRDTCVEQDTRAGYAEQNDSCESGLMYCDFLEDLIENILKDDTLSDSLADSSCEEVTSGLPEVNVYANSPLASDDISIFSVNDLKNDEENLSSLPYSLCSNDDDELISLCISSNEGSNCNENIEQHQKTFEPKTNPEKILISLTQHDDEVNTSSITPPILENSVVSEFQNEVEVKSKYKDLPSKTQFIQDEPEEISPRKEKSKNNCAEKCLQLNPQCAPDKGGKSFINKGEDKYKKKKNGAAKVIIGKKPTKVRDSTKDDVECANIEEKVEEGKEEGKPSGKNKEKKKKKKAKRSNSKCDITSPANSVSDLSKFPERRILKRGSVWKDKNTSFETVNDVSQANLVPDLFVDQLGSATKLTDISPIDLSITTELTKEENHGCEDDLVNVKKRENTVEVAIFVPPKCQDSAITENGSQPSPKTNDTGNIDQTDLLISKADINSETISNRDNLVPFQGECTNEISSCNNSNQIAISPTHNWPNDVIERVVDEKSFDKINVVISQETDVINTKNCSDKVGSVSILDPKFNKDQVKKHDALNKKTSLNHIINLSENLNPVEIFSPDNVNVLSECSASEISAKVHFTLPSSNENNLTNTGSDIDNGICVPDVYAINDELEARTKISLNKNLNLEHPVSETRNNHHHEPEILGKGSVSPHSEYPYNKWTISAPQIKKNSLKLNRKKFNREIYSKQLGINDGLIYSKIPENVNIFDQNKQEDLGVNIQDKSLVSSSENKVFENLEENNFSSHPIKCEINVSEEQPCYEQFNFTIPSQVKEAEQPYQICDSEVFTFSVPVSIIEPMIPSVEYVSDNSSGVSTRSNSIERKNACEILVTREISVIEEISSDDICIPALLSSYESSEPVNKINKSVNNSTKTISSTTLKDRSANSFAITEALSGMPFDDDDDVEDNDDQYYKSKGEKLYDTACACADDSAMLIVNNHNIFPVINPSIDMEEEKQKVVRRADKNRESNPQISNDTDDSDSTDTWHHKNIKEKIKKIIGSRIQPRAESGVAPMARLTTTDYADFTRGLSNEGSPYPGSSTHSSCSQVSSGSNSRSKSKSPPKCQPDGKMDSSFSTSLDSTLVTKARHGSKLSDVEDDNDVKVNYGKFDTNLQHLNLTFFSDSEETPSLEHAFEDESLILKASNQIETSNSTSIVQRWETLQTKALERQRQSNQLRQLQRQVKNLRLNLEGISSRSGAFGHPHVLDNPSQFSDKVEEAKALLGEMDNLKVELSSLNLLVHRFTTEVGQGQIPLKDEMAELYRLWDEVYRRVNGEVSRLQSAEATWRLWEEQKIELSKALKQDSDTLKVLDAAIHDGKLTETVTASAHDVAKLLNERRIPGGSKGNFTFQLPKIQSISGERGLRDQNTSNIQLFEVKEDRLSDSGTSGYESCSSDDLSERERRLAYLRRLARDLEASLEPGSKAWTEINMTLAKAEKELIGLQDQCRNLILRTAESLDQGPSPSRFPIVNSKRRSWARDGKSSSRSPRLERLTNSRGVAAAGGCRREWIWRVVRAALPFQAAFLLLLCVAYLLEPSCCDSVNTLNLTFSPQLRYVPGSPPV